MSCNVEEDGLKIAEFDKEAKKFRDEFLVNIPIIFNSIDFEIEDLGKGWFAALCTCAYVPYLLVFNRKGFYGFLCLEKSSRSYLKDAGIYYNAERDLYYSKIIDLLNETKIYRYEKGRLARIEGSAFVNRVSSPDNTRKSTFNAIDISNIEGIRSVSRTKNCFIPK